MIITIQGKITYKTIGFLILENNNIGYKVYFLDTDKVGLGADAKFFIHDHIREDRHDLFGFNTIEELSFFTKLLSISGIGPKSAQNIISLGLEKIEQSVSSGNSTLIESVPGVGKKTAQKIILELKGSIDKILAEKPINQDVLNALINLGYNRKQAEDALKDIAVEISNEEAQIKAALKLLSR